MTMREEWLEIAKKCERATGPNFKIEADIFEALNPGMNWIDHYCAPVTASLDRIVSLIERELPDWWWQVDSPFKREPPRIVPAQASMGNWEASVSFGAEAHTPALALCAAFCRAKASLAPVEFVKETEK